MIKKSSGIKRIYFDKDGSVTLEASVIMPVILLILFSLVFFSMYQYHRFTLLDTVVYTARQRAFTWDNSGKSEEDGFLPVLQSDGLYWRLYNDFNGYAKINKNGVENGGSPLVREKTGKAGDFIKTMLRNQVFKTKWSEINIRYVNRLYRSTVLVDIGEQIIIPLNWVSNIFNSQLKAGAQADIAEPVEFIRNTALAEKYGSDLINRVKGSIGSFGTEQQAGAQTRPLIASSARRYGQEVKVYHYPGCRYISQIKDVNRIEFATVEDANGHDYYLCLLCARRKAE